MTISALSPNQASMLLDTSESTRLHEALVDLTRDQLQWASGYAAGLAAAQAPAVVPSGIAPSGVMSPGTESQVAQPAAGTSLTILYGSQTGNSERIAKALGDNALRKGIRADVISLADYKPVKLQRESTVAFVVSTHGEGDPPDDAELFRDFLLSKRAPLLAGLRYSVLALGDSSYTNYCKTGREFDERLRELGATRVLSIVECDLDYDGPASVWVDELLQQLPGDDDPGRADTTAPKLRAVSLQPLFDKHRPFAADVLVNQKITAGDSTKDVRHIELSLQGSGIVYEPGDAVAVVAANPPELVSQILDIVGARASDTVTLGDDSMSLGQALCSELEITALNSNFLRSWAQKSRDTELEALLVDPVAESDLMNTHQLIDILCRFPAPASAQSLVDSLRKLAPRSYSIASSLAANPDELHLTVAAVRYHAFGRQHWGAASTQLADRIDEGDIVQVWVQENTRFRLPADDATDIIMIGAGTGVAPFRAFVEERAERGASGRNWLFFGDRNFSSDFLYQLEWQRHLKLGNLYRLDVAFSRDKANKVYVQDRIRRHGSDIWRWIDDGASVYVCGDAKRMAGDVDAALADVISRGAGIDREQAELRLKELRRTGRYLRDVY